MDYIKRMETEHIELVGKIEKLYKAIKILEGLSADELGLMYAQYYSMEQYSEILARRIGLAKELELKTQE